MACCYLLTITHLAPNLRCIQYVVVVAAHAARCRMDCDGVRRRGEFLLPAGCSVTQVNELSLWAVMISRAQVISSVDLRSGRLTRLGTVNTSDADGDAYRINRGGSVCLVIPRV